MPAKQQTYWQQRAKISAGTWYLNRTLDRWMERLWHQAVAKVNPPRRVRALDVGCGDGRFSVWVAERFHWVVDACDLFKHTNPRTSNGVRYFWGVDAEYVDRQLPEKPDHFTLVMVSGVLECVADWRKALKAALATADQALIVEDLREQAATYQSGLVYKTAITWPEFLEEIDSNGWRVVRWVPMTTVDRSLIVRSPKWLWWLVIPLSAVFDLCLMYVPVARSRARFRACLLRRM